MTNATRTEIITIADTQVPAAVGQDGKTYFSPKAICEGLGIDWPGQYVKIKADVVLASTVAEITTVAADGKQRPMVMLPKEMAPGWLFTIKKVAPEAQSKLNRFRLECFVALDTWFNKGLRNDQPVMQQCCVPQTFKEALLELIAKEEENERAAMVDAQFSDADEVDRIIAAAEALAEAEVWPDAY